MIIAIGSDHAGYPLKEQVIKAIQEMGHSIIDVGTNNAIEPVDYPDYVYKVGMDILNGKADRGILVCGSGVGASITANKMRGIYAGLCHDTYSAHQGVEHDGMNVLCLGGRIIGSELAREIVHSFLNAQVEEVERHQKRRGKMRSIESGKYKGK